MNPNVILKELDIIEDLLINIKNEENEETIDLIITKMMVMRSYL